jgi:hypothetical protein
MTTSIHPSFLQVFTYLFPSEILEHFVVVDVKECTRGKEQEPALEIILEEKNAPPVIPEQYRNNKVISKGFNHPQFIQDFPLRDHYCFLEIRTRRWTVEGMGTLTRELSFLPKEGLKVTTAFGVFLKEADRTRAGGSKTHRETLWSKETGENI